MQPNPVLKRLGLSDHDRVVIFHADDIGMCQSTLTAYADLLKCGLLSSASAMVPCPWFPALAAYCRDSDRDDIDMGVHLTLTSEWPGYRWGPLSTREVASGLVDAAGYFPDGRRLSPALATASAVQHEIHAQMQRALALGLDVTHIDSHMGAIFHPKFCGDYAALLLQFQLPGRFLRHDDAALPQPVPHAESAAIYAQHAISLEAQGVPMLDRICGLPMEPLQVSLEGLKRLLDDLPVGLTYIFMHPAKDTPELRAIAHDWPARVAHYNLFIDDRLHRVVQESGVYTLGYRVLRDLMREVSIRHPDDRISVIG